MFGDISMPIGQSYDRAHFLRACIEMCTISGGDDWAVVYCEGTGGCSIKKKKKKITYLPTPLFKTMLPETNNFFLARPGLRKHLPLCFSQV